MKKNNFSLIEFLVCMVIFAIVGGMVFVMACVFINGQNKSNQLENTDKKDKFTMEVHSEMRYGDIFEVTNTETGVMYTIYNSGGRTILLDKTELDKTEKVKMLEKSEK